MPQHLKDVKPKSGSREGRGSSRIDSLVITFKVLGLDQADQEDDDNDADYEYDDNNEVVLVLEQGEQEDDDNDADYGCDDNNAGG